jgi:Matrixin
MPERRQAEHQLRQSRPNCVRQAGVQSDSGQRQRDRVPRDWPYKEPGVESLAETTLFFDPSSGAIYDANIEINSNQHTFALANATGPEIDLNAVLTHQVGHFLGLSHSADPTATMAANYDPAMVTLQADDIAAICAALPPNRTPASNSAEPRHGFSGDCAEEQLLAEAGAPGTTDSNRGSDRRGPFDAPGEPVTLAYWRNASAARERPAL